MSPPDKLAGLSSAQLRELVAGLFAKLTELERTVAARREEIARLKGLKGRPDIRPSGMDKAADAAKPDSPQKRRRRGKVRPRVSVEDRVLKATAPGRVTLQGLRHLSGPGACAVGACDPLPARALGNAGQADHRRTTA